MQSATTRLENLINNEKTGHLCFANYSLKHIRYLLKYYGDPHKKFKTIHIAGTNGKGSVAHMLNSILIESGRCTGLYTSPHLIKINERIKINNREITDEILNGFTDELLALLHKNKNIRPTYFDALTLFAFRYFSEMKADIAVVEVGLGGRLDSTNVISPLVSLITDISIDHRNVLGSSLYKIAAEKAGIIKPRRPAVTSNSKSQVLKAIRQKAASTSSELLVLGRDFKILNKKFNKEKGTTSFDLVTANPRLPENHIKNIEPKPAGAFQARNASIAVTAALLLNRKGFKISEKMITDGLEKVTVPGRLHIVSKNPLIIFDPAHNIHALRETIKAIKSRYPLMDFKVILSFMTDKEYKKMFRIIRDQLSESIYYYELNDERCLKVSAEKNGSKRQPYKNTKSFSTAEDIYSSLKNALKPDSLIFVTGSFRLYSIAGKLSRMFKKGL